PVQGPTRLCRTALERGGALARVRGAPRRAAKSKLAPTPRIRQVVPRESVLGFSKRGVDSEVLSASHARRPPIESTARPSPCTRGGGPPRAPLRAVARGAAGRRKLFRIRRAPAA